MQTGCGCGSSGETLVFTCAGAAHSGQVANRAGVQAMQQGLGNLLCIASVAAHIADKTERTRKAARRVALDGCDDHCCRKILESAGLPVDLHLVLTDLGIEKKPAQPDLIGDAKKTVDSLRAAIA